MKTVVLFRTCYDMDGELAIAKKHIDVYEYRSTVPANSLVFARYSSLPHYDELEKELALRNSKLVNSLQEYNYISNIMDWGGEFGTLSGMTPRTWSNWARLPEGAFVLKGRINSRKHQWLTHMFAATRDDVPIVAARLLDDDLIRDQGVVIREYIPLKKIGEGMNGLPITNEWRTFWYVETVKGVRVPYLLASGYYWQASHPETKDKASLPASALKLVDEAAARVGDYASFFVLDVAETEAGDWIIIEVNDGQMSGLCGVDANELYNAIVEVTGNG